jgi:hypothetical protein
MIETTIIIGTTDRDDERIHDGRFDKTTQPDEFRMSTNDVNRPGGFVQSDRAT